MPRFRATNVGVVSAAVALLASAAVVVALPAGAAAPQNVSGGQVTVNVPARSISTVVLTL